MDARLKRRQAVSEAVADALILVANLVMLGRALQLVAAGTIDFAAAFVAVFTFVSSFGSVMAVSRLGASLQETLASGARVLDLLDERPQCAEVADGQNVEFAGAAAEHVSFSYVGGVDAGGAGATEQVANDTAASLILDDVTCTFAPGTMTCIMGRSGSGKSTLLKLLMRFWDPAAGTITVSGVDARHINTASLRSHEAYMTQDTHLFCGTVRENLLVAHASATDAELLDACRSASLTALIDRLPQGLDTPVAELGDSLSGGERPAHRPCAHLPQRRAFHLARRAHQRARCPQRGVRDAGDRRAQAPRQDHCARKPPCQHLRVCRFLAFGRAREAELMARPVDTPELARKREREAQMVSQMIALWCRGHHGGGHAVEQAGDDESVRVKLGLRTITLCPECAELQKYAIARIEHCPHMGTKTFCSACPSHCYRPAMREKIREVMRWSGPRMIRYRPITAVRHAMVTVQAKRVAARSK